MTEFRNLEHEAQILLDRKFLCFIELYLNRDLYLLESIYYENLFRTDKSMYCVVGVELHKIQLSAQ